MTKDKIYFDYAATTPVDHEVFEAMKPYFTDIFGNASSIHQFGQEARSAVDNARKISADFFDCKGSEIIFTGGATEANNLALKGILQTLKISGQKQIANPEIIISPIEHHSILDTARALQKEGIVVKYVPVDNFGRIKAGELATLINLNTVLVSVMYANNEIGTIEPIREISNIIAEVKKDAKKSNGIYPLFHTDAVQAVEYLDCNVETLGVDMLTMSAHKIYGPKGVGLLYVKRGTPIARIMDGGAQESGMRAGTTNIASVVGLAKALELIRKQDRSKVMGLRDKLVESVMKQITGVKYNGSKKFRLPNNANFSFEGAEGEGIVVSLDMDGFGASTGSACAAEGLEPSHVLKAIGLSDLDAHASLRLTLGRGTTDEHISKIVTALPPIIDRLRSISGGQAKREFKDKVPDDFGC
ncbi:MAG: cysteine desulfurase NifS [Candidatus Portnoybacteria bacterium CG10_big_fil_rev_8_21_14_0_10_36_7]|uniref:cysteine desulfurase n=1 Tax=Candidatus Portnoybacteria bacterium CG10_big_fil_rev_8_21_14_0_10_36_7 TaxID=1974812 RepID=A0A2M8KE34_9BACT|nr:MAG: cysteine desulfurase NifS [Candidatus Portnoybacteria bacterium CG10_big_fil_rev_8_21_14_0_10_36_7]